MAGYKMPIVCRDAYIPIFEDYDALTLEQYKELSGIDLEKLLELTISSNSINVRFKANVRYYLLPIGESFKNGYTEPCVLVPNLIDYQSYIAGSQDGYFHLAYFNDGDIIFGLSIRIDKANTFAKENIEVRFISDIL